MNWKISIFLLILFTSCDHKISENKSTQSSDSIALRNDYLIEARELIRLSKRPDIKIIDVRRKTSYDKEHIPNSLNIWRSDIENHTYPYKGMMASKETIEELFSTLGIDTKDTLVIYDDNALCDSARLWWILQNYDFTNVKLLNGGLTAWKASNGDLTPIIPHFKSTNFKLPENPSMRYYAFMEEVLQSIENETVLVDTRSFDEYTGKYKKEGATKGGRIPRSISIDWANAVNYDGDKKLKSITELKAIYDHLLPSKGEPLIAYCHSGVRSAHTTFVLTQLLDYTNVKNYDGSWSEWSYYDHIPFEQDSITTVFH